MSRSKRPASPKYLASKAEERRMEHLRNLPRAPLPKQRHTVDKVKTKVQPRQEKYKNNDHEDDGA